MAGPADPFDPVHIRKFRGNMKTQTFAELLIDAREDPHLRLMLVGVLRESRSSV